MRQRIYVFSLAAVIVINLLLFQWLGMQVSELRLQVGQLRDELRAEQREHSDMQQRMLAHEPLVQQNMHAPVRSDDVVSLKEKRRDAQPLMPIVVFCFNRAAYLNRTLTRLFQTIREPSDYPVLVSQVSSDASASTSANWLKCRCRMAQMSRLQM